MKVDMAGSAAVINAIVAVAELGLPVEVHAFAACCENMPSGSAYRLGDVLKSMNGKTVEINNTDAEGRLTLGDAITYALRQNPAELFDFATLTGACIVALGPHTAGVMSNDQALADRWLAAAKVRIGDDMWQLPLIAKLKDRLKSEVADMRNTGERWGGAITAGIFLREFVGSDTVGPRRHRGTRDSVRQGRRLHGQGRHRLPRFHDRRVPVPLIQPKSQPSCGLAALTSVTLCDR